MQTRQIGSLEVSVVGLGCNNFGWRLDTKGTDAVVGAALDEGITLFDTADMYGDTQSEVLLGKALGSRRDEIVVATKFGVAYGEMSGGASAAYVASAVDESLRRLGTDHIDLYQLHWPDASTPLAETLGALDELVKAGKIREIGCSNFTLELLKEAESASASSGGARFASVQNHYNLLNRSDESEVLPECEREKISFLPYFPLAHGLLSGKYHLGQPAPEGTRLAALPAEAASSMLSDANLGRVQSLSELAESEGHSILDLAFAWLLSRPQVSSVIAGATKPGQVKSNASTAGWVLSADLLSRIDEIVPA